MEILNRPLLIFCALLLSCSEKKSFKSYNLFENLRIVLSEIHFLQSKINDFFVDCSFSEPASAVRFVASTAIAVNQAHFKWAMENTIA